MKKTPKGNMIFMVQHSPGIWKSNCKSWQIIMQPTRRWAIKRKYDNGSWNQMNKTYRTLRAAASLIERKSKKTLQLKYNPAAGAGRPKKDDGSTLDMRWTLRLTTKDRAKIRRFADKYGMSSNEFALCAVREICKRCATKEGILPRFLRNREVKAA